MVDTIILIRTPQKSGDTLVQEEANQPPQTGTFSNNSWEDLAIDAMYIIFLEDNTHNSVINPPLQLGI